MVMCFFRKTVFQRMENNMKIKEILKVTMYTSVNLLIVAGLVLSV